MKNITLVICIALLCTLVSAQNNNSSLRDSIDAAFRFPAGFFLPLK